jgi:large subunit ribosomal protein L29
MKASDLREKSVEDLVELQKSLGRDVFQNRLKNFTNRLDDTSSIRKTKRDLARVLTLLRERKGGAPLVSVEASPVQVQAAAPLRAAASAPVATPAAVAAEPAPEEKAEKPKAASAKKASASAKKGEAK